MAFSVPKIPEDFAAKFPGIARRIRMGYRKHSTASPFAACDPLPQKQTFINCRMSQQHANATLPDYERPPVVETILGVQFEAFPGLSNAHLGAFWTTLDTEEWGSVADAPALQSQFEQFSESARWSKGLQIQLSQLPQCRLQIKNKTADRMIQVQNGRVHFNWLGESGGGYPHYKT